VSLIVAPRLMMRIGPRSVLGPGLALVTGGLLVFARAPVGAHYVTDLLPAMILLGVGAGLAFPAVVTVAMSSATADDAGLVSGLVNTTQQVGGALGLAVLATLSTTRTAHQLAGGQAHAAALTSGYHLAFVVAAGLVTAGVVVVLGVLRPVPAAAVQADTVSAEQDDPLVLSRAA
jgi:MFS family permease